MWDSDGDGDRDSDDDYLTAEEDYIAYRYEDLHDRLEDVGGLDEAYSEADVWEAAVDDNLGDDIEAYIDERRAEQVAHYGSAPRTRKGASGCETLILLLALLGFAGLCVMMALGSG